MLGGSFWSNVVPGTGPYASQPGGSGATQAGGFWGAAPVRLTSMASGWGGCSDSLPGFASPFPSTRECPTVGFVGRHPSASSFSLLSEFSSSYRFF